MRDGQKNPDLPGWQELHDFTIKFAVGQARSVIAQFDAQCEPTLRRYTSDREIIEHRFEWTSEFIDDVLTEMYAQDLGVA